MEQSATAALSQSHQAPNQAAPSDEPQRDQAQPKPVPSQPVAGAQVLVVDDMGTIRLMLTQHVRQLGHHVTQARNGREALDLLAAGKFDLVLLDIQMPEMDGHAVLASIKEDPRLRDIPVVMISGVDEIESVVRCIERGAEDYLPKPFNATLLKARIGACLEKKRLWDELGEKYRQLQELEKLRDSLTYMIVHDLRTPLTSIITGLQTVQILDEADAALRDEMLEVALGGGETLLGMINDLLDISKMEEGSMRLALKDTDTEALIDQAVQQVASLAKDKHLNLIKAIDPNLPPLRADEDKVRRTVVNLLGNAIKFTPVDGTLTVAARLSSPPDRPEEPGYEVLFSVSDTGEGIPQDAFSRIFEKFGQVESRKAGRKMSTGLGLTFCKMATEAHGGRIWVESELSKGSTFNFTIPLVRERTIS